MRRFGCWWPVPGIVLGLVGVVVEPAVASTPAEVSAKASVAVTTSVAVADSGGAYTALTGARLADTRQLAGPLGSGQVLQVQATGRGEVPASGVAAVALTITVTQPTVTGHVTVYPADAPVPGTSTVNYAPGQTVANQTMVAVSPAGAVAVRNAAGTVHVVVDVVGWFASGTASVAGGFVGSSPRRLLDTRQTSPLSGTSTVITLPVAGVGGVPGDVSGVVLNVTAATPTADTYLTVWPAGTARPGTSVVNAKAGTTAANLAVVGVGSGGAVAIAQGGPATTRVVVDLLGYLTAGPADPGGIRQVPPHRLIDTRRAGGAVGPGQSVEVYATGAGGVPLSRIRAVVLTVTAAPTPTSGGYLTVWPSGNPRPRSSTSNPRSDRPVAATGVFAVGADGGVNIYNYSGSVHLVIDATGYVPAPEPATAPALASAADTSPLTGIAQQQARGILATANRYGLRTWWPATGQTLLANPTASGADGVRRLSMEALGLSVAVRTGGYDAAATGVSAANATDVVRRTVDRVSATHMSNTPGGWGSSWQSSLWSSLAGRAGWLVWDDLPAPTRSRLLKMVEWEADQSLLVPIRYLRNRAGTVLTPGDSGAEENSWYALAPALAAAMFPTHPHWTAWRYQQLRLLVAAWARPADVSSSTLVDGQALSAWLGGSNVEPSGAVINHSRVAPDYSTTAYQSIDALLMAALAGTPAPQATRAGLPPVYAAQIRVSYPTPPYAPPGGTIYRSTSAIYYPQGCDWGTGQQLPYALSDGQAQLFKVDPTGTSAVQESRHATAAAGMQARNASGAMYSSTTEYNYVGREEHTAQLAGQLYLSYFVSDRLQPTWAPSTARWTAGARPLPGIKAPTATATRLAPTNERILQER